MMKFVLLLLCVGLAAAVRKPHFRDPVLEGGKTETQSEIDALFVGLTKIEEPHDPLPIEFNDERYFQKKEVIKKFMDAWEEGFIRKGDFFSLYHYKNRHDTYRFFDILFYARDYKTFMQICKWAKQELHPVQFVYGVVTAIMHRKDLSAIVPPNLYEVLPQYFIPSEIILGVHKANILGNNVRQFDVNSTGFEYNWYKGKTFESFKSGPKWNNYDMESRMSYFTEDVQFADFVAKTSMAYAPWLSDERYPEVKTERKGENLFHFYKHILTKYNLHRYANYLPPAKPLNFKSIIKTGYNPHLSTLHGRPFTPRPDGLYPFISNHMGVHDLFITKKRYDDVTDLLSYMDPVNNAFVNLEDNWKGLDKLGALVYGATNPKLRALYKPYHYQAFEALDDAVVASNAVYTTGSALSNYMTEVRDPVYYRVLATVQQVFRNYFDKLPPYMKDELEYPGVKVKDFEFSNLTTYFENYVFDITNSVPLKAYDGYNYTVRKTRLTHSPYSIKITIQSDKSRDAVIRSYFAPSFDADNRPLSTAEKVQQAVPFFFKHFDLKAGENVLKADSVRGFLNEEMSGQTHGNLRAMPETHAKRGSKCAAPSHLNIPKGGRPYTLFVIVSPYEYQSHTGSNPCGWDMMYGLGQTLDFPTNRRVIPEYFEQADNILFKEITINHYDDYTSAHDSFYEQY